MKRWCSKHEPCMRVVNMIQQGLAAGHDLSYVMTVVSWWCSQYNPPCEELERARMNY